MWGTSGKLRELKINIYISGSHAFTIPSAAMAMTANRPDVPFSFDDLGHWFSSPHAEQMM